jgi:hypothetical protein
VSRVPLGDGKDVKNRQLEMERDIFDNIFMMSAINTPAEEE